MAARAPDCTPDLDANPVREDEYVIFSDEKTSIQATSAATRTWPGPGTSERHEASCGRHAGKRPRMFPPTSSIPTACAQHGSRPAICPACYQKPKAICEGCGKLRTCARNRVKGGTSICATCRTRTIGCARCGRVRPFAANLLLGTVCDGCYSVIRRQITACPRCGRDELMIARDTGGTPICGPCTGRAVDCSCKRCGKVALKGAGRGLCYTCSATDRIDTLLSDYAGPDRDQVAAAVVGGRSGEAVWQYLEPGAPHRCAAKVRASR